MLSSIRVDNKIKIGVVIFLLLTVWSLYINLSGFVGTPQNYFFGATYGVMALLGGLWGLRISSHWGGGKSMMGRGIMFLALGLLAQEFGQIIFSYYNIFLKVETPYPSLADLGFFSAIPLYILGILFLGRAAGVQLGFRKLSNKIQLVVLPVVILVGAYSFFLRDHQYQWSNLLTVFLDFSYPMGQAIYLCIALLTYSLSKNYLGGIMKDKILIIIFAFITQFIADYNFLYQSSRGTWVNGGYGDYIYLCAYFIMTIGLLELNTVISNLKEKY